MKINFDQQLKNMDGSVAKDEKGEAITVSFIAVNALMSQIPDEKIDGNEKLKRYELASVVHKGGVIDVTVEDITKMKNLIGKVYPTLVVGQIFKILEGDNDDTNKKS